jgi:hypothetical protein
MRKFQINANSITPTTSTMSRFEPFVPTKCRMMTATIHQDTRITKEKIARRFRRCPAALRATSGASLPCRATSSVHLEPFQYRNPSVPGLGSSYQPGGGVVIAHFLVEDRYRVSSQFSLKLSPFAGYTGDPSPEVSWSLIALRSSSILAMMVMNS